MQVAAISRSNRSKVSNGSAVFLADFADGRSAMARRFRDLFAAIVSDMGGSDLLSEGQRQLARRAAQMCTACEVLESKSAAGEEIDLQTYGELSDRIGRAFHRLGLKRVALDVTPSLSEYLAAHAAKEVSE